MQVARGIFLAYNEILMTPRAMNERFEIFKVMKKKNAEIYSGNRGIICKHQTIVSKNFKAIENITNL